MRFGRSGTRAGGPLGALLLLAWPTAAGCQSGEASKSAAEARQEAPTRGMDARPTAAVSELLAALEEALEAQDAGALGRLFHPQGRLSDWRGRLARGPREVEAFYREAFRAHRETTGFRLADGREVRRGTSPLVALDFRFRVGQVRELGDTAAVVDGRWRTGGSLSPTGARLTGEGSRRGEGGPPYSGAYRMVAVFSGERPAVGLLHLDPYRVTTPPATPGPEPSPGPAPEPGPAPALPDTASSPGPGPSSAPSSRDSASRRRREAPLPSSPVYFGTTYENYAWGYDQDVCTVHPDGTVTVAHGAPDRAERGEVVSDTVGRLPADSVARYTRLVRDGIDTGLGPVGGGDMADFGTVTFWVVAPSGGPADSADGTWRVELAEAGDVRRPPVSPRNRELALWIHRSLDALEDAGCTLLSPVPQGRR